MASSTAETLADNRVAVMAAYWVETVAMKAVKKVERLVSVVAAERGVKKVVC